MPPTAGETLPETNNSPPGRKNLTISTDDDVVMGQDEESASTLGKFVALLAPKDSCT